MAWFNGYPYGDNMSATSVRALIETTYAPYVEALEKEIPDVVPGIFTEDFRFFSPDEINHEYRLTDEKTMINVGSVGQPRDGDPRACYVVVEDDLVRFRRVEYPIDETIQKIHDIPELDNFLGDRLRDGR